LHTVDSDALLLVVASAIVALDQVTKSLVTSRLVVVRFRAFTASSGVTRSTGQAGRYVSLSVRQAILVWFLVVACLQLTSALGAPLSAMQQVGLGLSLGGATGNLVDRLARGGVIDFIRLARWATFNLADAAMVCGIGVTASSLL